MINFDKKELKTLLLADAAVIGLILLYVAGGLVTKVISDSLPNGDLLPYCLCHFLFHLYCPFCGCTRAGIALLNLDFAASFAANPLIILTPILIFAFNVVSIIKIAKGKSIPSLEKAAKTVIAFLLVFCLVRNLLMIFFGFDTLGELAHFWYK